MELSIHAAAQPGIYIAFSLALYVWHVGAALLGVLIADRFGISDGGVDLKSDLKKMSACSLIALSLFFSLFYFAQHPAVFIAYILSFIISLNFAYLGESRGFLFVVQGTALMGMLFFVPAVALLRLPGMFLLYLAFLAAFLSRWQLAKKRTREARELEQMKERRIRGLARSDPGFTTYCYQCLYYLPDINRCQPELDGKEVRRITMDGKNYCTSFRTDRFAAPPRGAG
jgi:hypothetical protein